MNFQNNGAFFNWKNYSNIDMDTINEIQKQNAKTFSNVSQTATEAIQSVAHRQTENMRNMANDLMNINKNFNFGNPKELVNKQTDFAKQSVEKYSENFHEISEIIFKAGLEIFNTLSKRTVECMDQCSSMMNINSKAKTS